MCSLKRPQHLQSSTRDNVICMITEKESYATGVQSTAFGNDQKGLSKWKSHLAETLGRSGIIQVKAEIAKKREDSPTDMSKRLKMTE